MQVSPERTFWRDEWISQRHREYGWDCPAVDIDFLMLEYNNAKPAGIVEYKHINAEEVNQYHPSYQAMRALADASGIPFLVTVYNPDFARKYCHETGWMSERKYVELLYRIRGYILPPSMFPDLGGSNPTESQAKEINLDEWW